MTCEPAVTVDLMHLELDDHMPLMVAHEVSDDVGPALSIMIHLVSARGRVDNGDGGIFLDIVGRSRY